MKFEANTKYYIPNEEDQIEFQKACFEQGIYWKDQTTEVVLWTGFNWYYVNSYTTGKLYLTLSNSDARWECLQVKYPPEPTRPPSPKPEKVVLETTIKYGYNLPTLTQEQIEWLHGVMQEPLWGQEPQDEEDHHNAMRNFFFDITYTGDDLL